MRVNECLMPTISQMCHCKIQCLLYILYNYTESSYVFAIIEPPKNIALLYRVQKIYMELKFSDK